MIWKFTSSYRVSDDLVLVLCKVTPPETSDFPRACAMPISSGDHGVDDLFVSIGHANEDGEWWVAGWDNMQDCWTDARCFKVIGWERLPETTDLHKSLSLAILEAAGMYDPAVTP